MADERVTGSEAEEERPAAETQATNDEAGAPEAGAAEGPAFTAGDGPVAAVAPNLDQLVSSAVESIPELEPHHDAVETVFVCFMTYVGSDEIPVISTDAQTALTELSLTRGWSAEDIDTANDAVINGLADAWTALAEDFAATAAELPEGDAGVLDFEMVARRFAAERQEQDALRKRARQLLDLVKTVSGQLGIPNPDVVRAPESDPGWSEPAGRLASGLRRLASPLVSFVTEGEGARADAASGTASPTAPPSWITAPVLAEDDPDVRTLEQVVARRAASAADVRLIWTGLEALGLDCPAVTALLGQVATGARRQIAQSAEVMRNVTASHRQFADRIEAIQRMMGVTHAVHDFFFPKGAR